MTGTPGMVKLTLLVLDAHASDWRETLTIYAIHEGASLGIHANGHGSDAIQVEGGSVGLEDLDIKAADGVALRLKDAHLSSLRAVKAQGAAGDVVVETNSQVKTDAESVEALSKSSGNAFTNAGPATLRLHG